MQMKYTKIEKSALKNQSLYTQLHHALAVGKRRPAKPSHLARRYNYSLSYVGSAYGINSKSTRYNYSDYKCLALYCKINICGISLRLVLP